VPVAWDTTTAARLRPDSPVLDHARERWRAGDPIAFTATTLKEISHGLRKAAASGRQAAGAQLRWLRDQIDAGLIDVLAFDDRAADIAGALRATIPTPPSASRRPRDRSKAENRVAWVLDIQIAATVFAHGYDLLTADTHHAIIATRLATLAPTAPALQIHAPPQF
jgi:predicted nucleic acid-binding protein